MALFRIEQVASEPLEVPLAAPFVIAGARVERTPNLRVRVTLREASGAVATGLGEAATLHPVTRETASSVAGELLLVEPPERLLSWEALSDWLAGSGLGPVARCGLSTGLWDARARLAGVPLWRMLGATAPVSLESDITLSIGDAGSSAKAARRWWGQGFRCFKVKVGRDVDQAVEVLEALHAALPEARLRVDANAALTSAEALALGHAAERLELPVECWEQPCGRLALEAMAEVTAGLQAPVVADESVATVDDLRRVVRLKAARGVNLKLVKSGGLDGALRVGREAQLLGLPLMCGAMVETRLGITAALQLATALGGVAWPDLDTAFLMASDPFEGGYDATVPRLQPLESPGLGVTERR